MAQLQIHENRKRKTLEENREDLIESRKMDKSRMSKAARDKANGGFKLYPHEDTEWKIDYLPKVNAFCSLNLRPSISKVDLASNISILTKTNNIYEQSRLFRKIVDPDLLESILSRVRATHPAYFYSTQRKGELQVDVKLLYKYYAAYIRVQGLQNTPTESNRRQDARRVSFQEALHHFKTNVNDEKTPGIAAIELIHGRFYITKDEEALLNERFQQVVTSLGQHVAGDEKLFHFTGRSGILRLVPNKPGQIGSWNYELAAKLKNGQPYLLYIRSYTEVSTIGEGVTCVEVIGEWADIVERLSTNDQTILVVDCFYLDSKGRELLLSRNLPFVCAVQKSRFHTLAEQAENEVSKAGELALLYKKRTQELFVHYWYPDRTLGKKYVLTNIYTPSEGTPTKEYIPGCDDFALMFSTCDNFNRDMNDKTWPHRLQHGDRHLNNFYMTCILLNVKNAWLDLNNKKNEDVEWVEFMTELADELYEYACNI
jgi:hypothetical protein